jgi:exodeoxyribonuclease V gamma subunit
MLIPVASNRLDVLARHLAQMVTDPGSAEAGAGGLFHSTPVLVASLGVGDWLRRHLADVHGVASNLDIGFLARWVWRQVERQFPQVEAAAPVPGQRLRWLIDDWLRRRGPQFPALAPLSADAAARWQLAGQVAGLFGDYLIYRPDWLSAWAAGGQGLAASSQSGAEHLAWQRTLWRELAQALGLEGSRHPLWRFVDALDTGASDALPKRVVLFAIPAIAPLYAEFLGRLGAHCDIVWYRLAPSRAALATWQPVDAMAGEEPASDVGAVEGALRRLAPEACDLHRAQQLAADRAGRKASNEVECFVDPLALLPQGRGLARLTRLQRAWLDPDARHDGQFADAQHAGAPAASAQNPNEVDTSLLIHACTSALRQTEVLADLLERRFADDRSLRADEVLVLCTDLERFAPAIDTIFGGRGRLPYRLAGRDLPPWRELDERLAELLRLPASRFEAGMLLGWLECEAIGAAFGLSADAVAALRPLCESAGVVWGRNAEQRVRLGLPPVERHGWSWAMARVLLGQAAVVTANADDAVAGIDPLPWSDAGVEFDDFGRLLRFLERCEHWAERLARPRPPESWADEVDALLATFFVDPGASTTVADWRARQRLALDELRLHARPWPGTEPEPVTIDVIASLLAERAAARSPAARPGPVIGVTRLGELRGLPRRIVAVLGLEADVFPGSQTRLEYDLMRLEPRTGDRARQAQPLGALLDALLAAEEACWLFYDGRDPQTHEVWPPALAVADLESALAELEPGVDAASPPWRRQHPLLPRAAGAAVAGERVPPVPPRPRRHTAAALAGFVGAPAHTFLQERHGLSALDEGLRPAADEGAIEPIALDGMSRWRIGARLVARMLEQPTRSHDDLLDWLEHAPELAPQAAWPRLELLELIAKAEAYARVWRQWHQGPRDAQGWTVEPKGFDLAIDCRVELAGDEAACCALLARFAKPKLRDVAACGVLRCLMDCAPESSGLAAAPIVLLHSEGSWVLPPLDRATAASQLARWLDDWLAQRERRSRPWPLPAATTLAYLSKRHVPAVRGKAADADPEERALREAAKEWSEECREPLWRWLLEPSWPAADESLPPDPWRELADAWFGQWFGRFVKFDAGDPSALKAASA